MAVIDLINKTNFLPTKLPIKVPAEKANEIITRLNSISSDDGEILVDTISVDIISEYTAAAGVTVDGILLKDGNIALPKEGAHSIKITNTTTAATAGGVLTIDGAAGQTSGAGGDINVTGGVAGATGAGGAIDIDGGVGGVTSGNGGAIEITGGAANAAGTGVGGTVDIDGGRSYGANTGGVVLINGGLGGPNQVGGAITITGGAGNTAAAGANVILIGGPGAGANVGGNAVVYGGTGGAAGNGGDAILEGGAPLTTGTGGTARIHGGDAVNAAGNAGDVVIQPGDAYNVTGGDTANESGDFTIAIGASGTAETGTGGAGGDISLQGSAGGAASGVAGTGGEGSAIAITCGNGGATTENSGGAETGGAGGALTVSSGDGGAIAVASTGDGGHGGQLTISTGDGGAATAGVAGNGGELYITAGAAGATTTGTEGEAGFVVISGGAGGAVDGNGGSVTLGGGAGAGLGVGGSVYVGDSITGQVVLDADAGIHAAGLLTSDLYYRCWDFDDSEDGAQLDAYQTDFNVQWVVGGGNHAGANQLLQVENNGNLELTTAGGGNDSEVVTSIHPVLVDTNPIFEVRFKVNTVTTTELCAYMGLTETATPLVNSDFEAVTDDFILVGIDTGEANPAYLRLVTDDTGGSGQAGTIDPLSSKTIVVNTYCTVRVDCTNIEQPRVWANMSGGAISPTDEVDPALITGTLQTGTTLYPVIFAEDLAAAAKVLTVDYFKIWHDRA